MAVKRRPRGPSRSKAGFDPKLPRCRADASPKTFCDSNGTLYRAHQWWCQRHAPDIPIPPNCAHPHFGITPDRMLLCAWCCAIFACLLPREAP